MGNPAATHCLSENRLRFLHNENVYTKLIILNTKLYSNAKITGYFASIK